MPYSVDAAGRSRLSPDTAPGALDRIDRILLGACAAIWLAALGAGVAATVALVDLGRGHPARPERSDTPWLLYAVIGISAVVIVGAVPLLLRARRSALDGRRPARTTGGRPAPGQPPSARGAEAPTEKFRASMPYAEQVNPRPGYPAPPAAIRAAPSSWCPRWISSGCAAPS